MNKYYAKMSNLYWQEASLAEDQPYFGKPLLEWTHFPTLLSFLIKRQF